ncbi:MAG: hypothetical protein ABEH77_04475 [Halobacteriaceae archaeon]
MGEGPPLSRRAFVRRLRRLPHGRLAAFVADLWSARGWETAVRDGHVVASRDGQRRRLLVHRERRLRPDETPPAAPRVDAVVTTGGEDGAGAALARERDADLVTAGDLYEAVVYGLDRPAAKALLWDHLGAPTGRPLSGEAVGRVGALALALAVVVAVAAGAGGVLSGGPGERAAALARTTTAGGGPGTGGGATTPATIWTPEYFAGGLASTTTAAATAHTTRTLAPAERALVASPTCERSPEEVVRTVVLALGDTDTDAWQDGVRAAWRFLSPGARRGFGSYFAFAESLFTPAYAPLRNATDASLGPTVRTGNATVTQPATVVGPAGERTTFRFELVRQSGGENDGCWLVGGIDARDGTTREATGPARATPTCERGPGEVVETVVGLLRTNDPATNNSLRDAWRFLAPTAAVSFGSVEEFRRTVYSARYAPLRHASNVSYGPVNRTGGTATRRVSVASPRGEATYAFSLSEFDNLAEGSDCWRVGVTTFA